MSRLVKFVAAVAVLGIMRPVSALEIGMPVLESYGVAGLPALGPCGTGFLSANGRFLTFACASENLTRAPEGDTNPYQSYLLDRQTRALKRVDVTPAGQIYHFSTGPGFVSDDGRNVIFNSDAPLDPSIPVSPTGARLNNSYIRDVAAGTTRVLGRDAFGIYRAGAYMRSVAWATTEVTLQTSWDMRTGLFPPAGSTPQLFVRNWVTGAVELISARLSGGPSLARYHDVPNLSPDGRYVVFTSAATDISTDNPLGYTALFLRDRVTQTTRRITYAADGGEFSSANAFYLSSSIIRITADNRYLVFSQLYDELTVDDNPGWGDVYLLELATNRIELVSKTFDGRPTDGASRSIDISADGRYMAFFSRATNLLPTPQSPAVYVKDRQTGELLNISAPLGPMDPMGDPHVSMAADGRTVSFDWLHPNSAPNIGGRQLIYTVSLRQPVPYVAPVAVTTLDWAWRWMLIAMLCGGGYWVSGRRRQSLRVRA